MNKKTKVYPNHRISVNPLCEYVAEAGPARRNSIIKQCKKPIPYIVKLYNDAEDIISLYLSVVKDNPKLLVREASRLLAGPFKDDNDKKCAQASAGALKAFKLKELALRGVFETYVLGSATDDTHHKFMMNGVQISLRPELIVRAPDGKQQLGFIKLYFSKGTPLSKERAEMIACLTKNYFEEEFGFGFKPEHCFVLDVFEGKLYNAPKAYKRSLANIKAACQEIADRWHSVEV